MFLARDLLDNGLHLWPEKPKRALTFWYSGMVKYKLDSALFPLLTWKHEPIEVEIVLKKQLH